MNFTERIASTYKDVLASAPAGEKRFREEAWAQYSHFGLPDRKTETWKYSNLNALTKTDWPLAGRLSDSAILGEVEQIREKWRLQFDIAVVLDGHFRQDLSETGDYKISALDLSSVEDVRFEDGWSGLSAALARPGFSLEISGARAKRPLLIVQAHSGGAAWSTSVNRIALQTRSSAELGSVLIGPNSKYLRSDITFVELGESSRLVWARIQRESQEAYHFSEVQARILRGAHLNLTQLNGGAAWSRTSLRSRISGDLGEAHIHGLTFGRASQHIDQRVEVRHSSANTSSSQLFKGVLKDTARGVLNGKIVIDRDAQKVVSSQLNHNLLLSKTAEADTKPELEIYADDVKANHGASVGRMDEEKLFYLMSRGIPRAQAQEMLAHAFVGDVLMKIDTPLLHQFADENVRGWLPDFMSGMEASV
jgi:Fe-S cluster assembly protein SufD